MKLIIDIPKDYYEIIKHDVENHLTDYRPFEIIANGIPLDSVIKDIKKERYNQGFVDGYKNSYDRGHAVIEDIKAEIDKLHKVGNADDGRVYVPINDVFDVIDKHIGKAESEVV